MDWKTLDNGEFRGLETFLPDGTAVDIVEYGGSGDWCWMIRVPVEDDYTTHEVYASYDDGTYFGEMCEALDAAMEYLGRFFPGYAAESRRYEKSRWTEKVSLLQAAAAVGIVAVFSASLSFGLPMDAYASEGFSPTSVVEPAGGSASDEIVFGRDADGQPAYFVGSMVEATIRSAVVDARQPDHVGQARLEGDLLVLSAYDGAEAFASISDNLRSSLSSLLQSDEAEFRAYELDASESREIAASSAKPVFDYISENPFTTMIIVFGAFLLSPFVVLILKLPFEIFDLPSSYSEFRAWRSKKRRDREDMESGYHQAMEAVDRIGTYRYSTHGDNEVVKSQLQRAKQTHQALMEEIEARFSPTKETYDEYVAKADASYTAVIANSGKYAEIAYEYVNGGMETEYEDTPMPELVESNDKILGETRAVLSNLIEHRIDWRSEGTEEVAKVIGVLTRQLELYENKPCA